MIQIQDFKSAISRNLFNIPGWKTKRKILVIESDDWGSIRIPSAGVLEKLSKKIKKTDSNPFNLFDSLETEADLFAIYDVLKQFRDRNGNHPIITANFVVANPDFEKIKASNFADYYYESILETYKRTPETSNSFHLILEGINQNIIRPQFHGREHLNVAQWLTLLQANDPDLKFAFDLGVISIEPAKKVGKRNNLLAAFDFENSNHKNLVNEVIADGFNLFEKIFGYKSLSFIAPCNVWHKDQEMLLGKLGALYIQGLRNQFIPDTSQNNYKKAWHYMGEKNNFNQIYFVRNCFFEPSTITNFDWLGHCLKRVASAFFWGKPAIVSMHRLNLMGGISEKNRKKNLELLGAFLKAVLLKWPDVEFMSTDELGLITEKSK